MERTNREFANKRGIMADYIQGGWAAGHVIRTARKAGRCDYWEGGTIGRCPERIEKGQQYVEGDRSDWKAGGFGCDRWCMKHFKEDE